MVLFKEPNFGMASTSSSVSASGRDKVPLSSRSGLVSSKYTRFKPGPKPTPEERKLSMSPALLRRSEVFFSGRLKIFLVGALVVILAVTAGVVASRFATFPGSSKSPATRASWRPTNGTTWQIELSNTLNDTSFNAQVYDIDLYDNDPTVIKKLHSLNRKVICYFSAGAYEASGPDHGLFHKSDYGIALSEETVASTEEKWLDTRSDNVRSIMLARLDMAQHKGCDGVDPDHTDGYLYSSGFPLTKDTTVEYIKFLASAALERGLSIGLRNNPAVVLETLGELQWAVVEACEGYSQCALYKPYILTGKPVFHYVISYDDELDHSGDEGFYCNGTGTANFSTIVKRKALDTWVSRC
jgi:hypothetical protein